MSCQIDQDIHLGEADVEALRVAVGWDPMHGVYDRILDRSYTHFSIADGPDLIAFVNVLSDGIGDAFLVDLMVHPDYQGKGLGKSLVTYAVKNLTGDGIRCIQVTFDPELERFYRGCGFPIITKAGTIDNAPAGGPRKPQ